MDKAKLPREVAESIDYLREHSWSNYTILHNLDSANVKAVKKIQEFTFKPINYNVLLKALVNGYEVELTPEEEIKKIHDETTEKIKEARFNRSSYDEDIGHSFLYGVETTLRILGIKIEGVNE